MIKKHALAKSRFHPSAGSTPFQVISSTTVVDGTSWYTVLCDRNVGRWIRENFSENDHWYEHQHQRIYHHMLDVSDSTYTMMLLRWS